MNRDEINILHLSDLHFNLKKGGKISELKITQRKFTLEKLLDYFRGNVNEWKPDIIAISGDVGWAGKEEDYSEAKQWILELLHVLKISPDHLIICAGNHDLDRDKISGMGYPESAKQADNWLSIDHLDNLLRPFLNFQNFLKDIGCKILKLGDKECSLAGFREIFDINFIILNSAWFSRGDNDEKNLWLGLPQLHLMELKGHLPKESEYDRSKITISLFHHPPSKLSNDDFRSKVRREAAYSILCKRVHIILVGHMHPEVMNEPTREQKRAWIFNAGATYKSIHYNNNVSIYKIDKKQRYLIQKVIKYDPSSSNWKEEKIFSPTPLISPALEPVPTTEIFKEVSISQTSPNDPSVREKSSEFILEFNKLLNDQFSIIKQKLFSNSEKVGIILFDSGDKSSFSFSFIQSD